MFIELVDRLRCPAPHRDSWLVVRMDRVENRRIISGALGCPVCGAEYPIEHGAVKFSAAPAPLAPALAPPPPDAETGMRIAAGLALGAANAVAILHGSWGAQAELVRAIAPAQLLVLNPPAGVQATEGVSVVFAETAPFAAASVDAVAIDETAGVVLRDGMIGAVRNGGRVLSTQAVVGEAVSEVLATGSLWIGEVRHPGPTVPLRRRVPGSGIK